MAQENPAEFERDVVRAARRVVCSVPRGSRPTFDISGKSVRSEMLILLSPKPPTASRSIPPVSDRALSAIDNQYCYTSLTDHRYPPEATNLLANSREALVSCGGIRYRATWISEGARDA
jgi:hypothetical protein